MGSRKRKAGTDSSRFVVSAKKRTNGPTSQEVDSEDEFHAERDKIFLDVADRGRDVGGRNDLYYEPSDEEILPLNATDSSDIGDESNDDAEREEYPIEDEDFQAPISHNDRTKPSRTQSSEDRSLTAHEDEDEPGWGMSKSDYYSVDANETAQDALMEEKEAQRLRQKELHAMTEEDFGLGQDWIKAAPDPAESTANGALNSKPYVQKLYNANDTKDKSSAQQAQILQDRFPEVEALSQEYLQLIKISKNLEHEFDAQSYSNPEQVQYERFRRLALNTYLGALAFYFVILTQDQNSTGVNSVEGFVKDPAVVHSHPIMETIIRARDTWYELQGRTFEAKAAETAPPPTPDILSTKSEAEPDVRETVVHKKAKDRPKSQHKAKIDKPQTSSRNAFVRARGRELDATLLRLGHESLETKHATNSQQNGRDGPSSDESELGERNEDAAIEGEGRRKMKKTLGFYTSRITQQANKNSVRGREAGGDADIPYKERNKDKMLRIQAEAEARGQKTEKSGRADATALTARDADSPPPSPGDQEDGVGKGADEDEDYYDFVSAKSKAKKARQADLDELYNQAKAEGGTVRIQDDGGVSKDGKRAISYAIEKNKGLHSTRSRKDVRNPRVKKRHKFEDRQKKLATMRQVYRGGESKAGYQGEKTGIKKGLVRGIRL